MWRDEYVVENPRETAKAPLFVIWLVARVALSSRASAAAARYLPIRKRGVMEVRHAYPFTLRIAEVRECQTT